MSISPSTICAFVVLSISLLGKADVICIEKANGCSVPGWTFYFLPSTNLFIRMFEEDCNLHDLCYSCVSTTCLNVSNWQILYRKIL